MKKRHSFAWPFNIIGVFGVIFLLVGLLEDVSQFSRVGGKPAFIILGVILMTLFLIKNEIVVDSFHDTYKIKQGLAPFLILKEGKASGLKAAVRSDNDGGYLVYLLDNEKVVMQVESSTTREAAYKKAEYALSKLGLPPEAMEQQYKAI